MNIYEMFNDDLNISYIWGENDDLTTNNCENLEMDNTDDYYSLNDDNQEFLGSEMNPIPKVEYYEGDHIVYEDSNGCRQTGLILDKFYQGGHDNFQVERTDGTVERIYLVNIKGEV
jgi:hypothetical protein